MGMLRVSLFGSVRVCNGETPLEMKLTRPMQGILAYLILNRHRTHPREMLAEIFWGDKSQDRSRASLNTALWQLRNAMEPDGVPRGTYLLSDHPNEVGFNPQSPFWLDVQAFEEGTHRFLQPDPVKPSDDCVEQLENIILHYKGDLLEGFYEDWVLREREYLRARYLAALGCLMGLHWKRADHEKSLACGQKILEMDPLREEVHRYMMQLYLEAGQRARAIQQYEICSKALARELHIEPMPETQELYHHLIASTPISPAPARPIVSGDLSQALLQLSQAKAALEQARDQLQLSIQTVENIVKQEKR
jgi:DNA-binding SARP family transcriptional activator